MQKMKKGVALALTAAMVLGGSMTAFAEDPVTSGTGSTSGAGTSEGHVEKEKLNVVLPTIASGSTPFAYKMDPERLIQETNGGKYDGVTFPAADADTGVYFLTAEKTYANTSNTLQAINKSSCDIDLTVTYKATANADATKDIPLVESAPASSETAAKLYLGLIIGSETKALSTTEANIKKTISGSPNNFETAVKDGAYAYQEKADASTWKAMNIAMTGAVNNKAIAGDTTAPTIDVTWSWAKAAEGATAATDEVTYTEAPADVAPSIDSEHLSKTVAADTPITIPVNLGTGSKKATAVTSVNWKESSNKEMLNVSNMATYADGVVTITTTSINYLLRNDNNFPATIVIVFDDTAHTSIEVTLTK